MHVPTPATDAPRTPAEPVEPTLSERPVEATAAAEPAAAAGAGVRTPRLVPSAEPFTPTSWTPAQQRVLDHRSGPLLVLGGPGTGKTALAAEYAASRLRSGDRPALVIALTRQSASTLRDTVTRLVGGTIRQPPVLTLHALSRSLLTRFGDPEDAPPRVLTAPEQEFRIRELLAIQPPSAWPEALTSARGTAGFARQVRGALARARHLGLDPINLVEAGAQAGDPTWQALGQFMEGYLDVLDAEQSLDYAELVHRCRLLLERVDVAAAVHAEYSAVVVDEFAELDPAQIGLVRALVPDGMPVVALTDPDTAIFRFRGAHPRAASAFLSLFASAEVPVCVLTDDFRQADAPAAAALRVAGRLGLPALEGAALAAYRARRPVSGVRGRAQAATFSTADAEARYVAGEVRAANLDGTAWTDMAVVVRSGEQVPRLVRALIDGGVPVEVAGDEIGLASEAAVRPLLLALELAATQTDLDGDQARRLLTSAWGGLDAVALRVLVRRLRPAGQTLASEEVLARALSGSLAIPDDGGPSGVLATRVDLLSRTRRLVASGCTPERALWELWNGTDWPQRLRATALRTTEAARRAHRDLDAVVALFGLAAESQAGTGEAGVRAFLAEVAAQQIPADVQRESAVHGRGVRVLTVHRTKGRAWPFVVVAGVQEGVWPDIRRRGSILDPQRLGNAGLGDGVRTRDLVANERRLFLLALTRARSRLLVTAVEGTDGEANQPSRFVGELGLDVALDPPGPGRLTTLTALVARLRAATMDAALPPEVRSAAASRLALLADEADAAGRPLVPAADPQRWWGTAEQSGGEPPRPDAIVLSPSQLTSVLQCPRQYFLGREARAEPRRGSAAILGSVIHLLAEHALAASDRDDALAHLDEVWDRLPFQAAWLSATERAAAEEAVERIAAWQASNSAEVLGVEASFTVSVEVDGEQVTVRGTVDRLERETSGRLRVIDFKSSRSVPTAKEVATHEQLGLYQLAVDEGAFGDLAPQAASAGGSLVFVRHGDGYPKVLHQESLASKPHPEPDDPGTRPTWVHERLARAAATVRSGRYDATPGPQCRWCAFASSCPARTEGRQVIA